MSDDRIHPIVMPKWGLSMEEGKLSSWLADEGADIGPGDDIMEVETDKITNVVEATKTGVLRRRLGEEGVVYPVRALLGVLADRNVAEDEIDAFVGTYDVPQASGRGDAADAGPVYEFIETPSGRLRYAKRGESGAPVVLVHGFGGDLDNWLFNIDALAEVAKVCAFDLPGHGQSAKALPDGGLEGLARALGQFMDGVGFDAAHLVGHSMGGAVVANLALSAPERATSLTLIDSAGLGHAINGDYISGFVGAQSRRELKPVLKDLFADPNLVNRKLVDDLLRYKRLDGVTEALSDLAASLFAGGRQTTVLAGPLGRIECPRLVIWGGEDAVIPASDAYAVDGAVVEVVAGAGHMVQMEAAGKVNELIIRHMAGS